MSERGGGSRGERQHRRSPHRRSPRRSPLRRSPHRRSHPRRSPPRRSPGRTPRSPRRAHRSPRRDIGSPAFDPLSSTRAPSNPGTVGNPSNPPAPAVGGVAFPSRKTLCAVSLARSGKQPRLPTLKKKGSAPKKDAKNDAAGRSANGEKLRADGDSATQSTATASKNSRSYIGAKGLSDGSGRSPDSAFLHRKPLTDSGVSIEEEFKDIVGAAGGRPRTKVTTAQEEVITQAITQQHRHSQNWVPQVQKTYEISDGKNTRRILITEKTGRVFEFRMVDEVPERVHPKGG